MGTRRLCHSNGQHLVQCCTLQDSHVRLLCVGQLGECLGGHPAVGQVAEALGHIHPFCLPREAKVSQFQVLASSHEDVPARQVPVQDTQSSQVLLERREGGRDEPTLNSKQTGDLCLPSQRQSGSQRRGRLKAPWLDWCSSSIAPLGPQQEGASSHGQGPAQRYAARGTEQQQGGMGRVKVTGRLNTYAL